MQLHIYTEYMHYNEHFKCWRFKSSRFHRLNFILHINTYMKGHFVISAYNLYIL